MAKETSWETTVNELAKEYSEQVTSANGKEIIYSLGRITGTMVTVDLRTEQQKKIARQVISLLVPYIKLLAQETMSNHYNPHDNYGLQDHYRPKPKTERTVSIDDLAQDGALEIIPALGKYEPTKDGAFVSYVAPQLKNLMSRQLPAAASKNRRITFKLASYNHEQSMTELLQREEQAGRLGQLLATLPPWQELIIRASYYDGKSPNQIAEKLKHSVSEIQLLTAQAFHNLSQKIDKLKTD